MAVYILCLIYLRKFYFFKYTQEPFLYKLSQFSRKRGNFYDQAITHPSSAQADVKSSVIYRVQLCSTYTTQLTNSNLREPLEKVLNIFPSPT